MHGSLSKPEIEAIEASDTSVVEETGDDKSVANDEHWFRDLAQCLLSHKAGTALHFTTGFDERSCQRYAAGQVKPPAYFFRTLLRSEQGWVWLAGAMHGCDAGWWRELRENKRLADKARAFIASTE